MPSRQTGSSDVLVLKGEIQNVLTVMRLNSRYSSHDRFKRELIRSNMTLFPPSKEEKERFEEEKKREEAKSALEKEAGRHRKRIEEEVMTLRCPRCAQAFESYNGCAALTCSNTQCKCGFCAICLQDCGGDAHEHCQQVHGGYSVSTLRWKEMMRALKQKRLEEYLQNINDEDVKKELLNDNSIRGHFNDLNMAIPGEGRFSGKLAQLKGMGFDDDGLNLRVLREVDGDVQIAVEKIMGQRNKN